MEITVIDEIGEFIMPCKHLFRSEIESYLFCPYCGEAVSELIEKKETKHKKYSFFPSRSTRKEWWSSENHYIPIYKLPQPYLDNIIKMLWDAAEDSCQDQATIDLYTTDIFPGRFNLCNPKARIDAFLTHMVPAWPKLKRYARFSVPIEESKKRSQKLDSLMEKVNELAKEIDNLRK